MKRTKTRQKQRGMENGEAGGGGSDDQNENIFFFVFSFFFSFFFAKFLVLQVSPWILFIHQEARGWAWFIFLYYYLLFSQVANCPVWANFTNSSQNAQKGFKNTQKTSQKKFLTGCLSNTRNGLSPRLVGEASFMRGEAKK